MSMTLYQRILPCSFRQHSVEPARSRRPRLQNVLLTLALSACLTPLGQAQDRLPAMPGYARYREQTRKLRDVTADAFKGAAAGGWTADGSGYIYRQGGKTYKYDVAQQKSAESNEAAPRSAFGGLRGGGGVARGRQVSDDLSPDGKWKAAYKDANVWLSGPDDTNPFQVTQDGSRQNRLFYGTASWVYGEELEQHTAMWWSPDSKKLAYYRFDESKVPDYYVTMRNLQIQDQLDAEPYPKAGAPNPIVDIYVYDLSTKQTTRLDVRDGKPFDNEVVGHYVYNPRWTPDGTQLLFYRTNRLQNIMEVAAADPKTGACHAIVRETRPQSWTTNLPALTFLKDGQRFILASERNGWRNFYLYNLSGKLLQTLTKNEFEADRVERVDEAANVIYYTARDGDNMLKPQLHRVRLDGTGDTRLTDPRYSHRVDVSPDGKFCVDIAQSHDTPAMTRVLDAGGTVVSTLAEGDLTAMKAAGFSPPESFTYKAGDGATDVHGLLYKPSNFDATKKYPLLVDVYAGPETPNAEMVTETFRAPQALAELGFLVASFDGRGTLHRGKAYIEAIYRKLGQADIDDQALGVKFLRQRSYVDGTRVGIYGTSYGGYASIMCLLRYPDVFQAACASSAVTDWRNYDSIYTERFMGLPQQNKTDYDAGSAMTYVNNLKGKLLLYYGTADNNVHPSNTLQLVSALERAGKSYDLQVGPDRGHSGINSTRMLEFFMDTLVLTPTPPTQAITR